MLSDRASRLLSALNCDDRCRSEFALARQSSIAGERDNVPEDKLSSLVGGKSGKKETRRRWRSEQLLR